MRIFTTIKNFIDKYLLGTRVTYEVTFPKANAGSVVTAQIAREAKGVRAANDNAPDSARNDVPC